MLSTLPSTGRNRPSGGTTGSSPSRSARSLQRLLEHVSALRLEYIPHPSFSRGWTGQWTPIPDAPRSTPVSPRGRTGLSPYIHRLYQVALLTPEQEVEAFRWMNYLKCRASKLRDRLRRSTPTRAALREIERLAAQAGTIRDRLIEANLRLVVSIAKKFADPLTPLEDLVSEGNVALMRAVERFDFSRGFRFSTYATYAIQRALYQAVTQLRRRRSRFVSREGLPNEDAPWEVDPPEDERWQRLSEFHDSLHALVERLDTRQQAIIRRRFGLGDGSRSKTLRELAAELGVCKERVRQLEARALRDLRSWAAEAHPNLFSDAPWRVTD